MRISKKDLLEQFDMDARPLVDNSGVTPYDDEIYPEIGSSIVFEESGYLR